MTMAFKRFFGGRREMDMTQGSVIKTILVFAFPLLVGNLFQQFYNMVDTWVIGQAGLTEAFAAVGNVGPIINMVIGFFVGLSGGTGVVISQFYGAKDYKRVHDAVHTAIAVTLVMGVICTVVGVVFTPYFLNWIFRGR